MKTHGRMVKVTEGGFFPAGVIGRVVGTDSKGTSLVQRIHETRNTIRVNDEHLVYVEQRWVECEDQS